MSDYGQYCLIMKNLKPGGIWGRKGQQHYKGKKTVSEKIGANSEPTGDSQDSVRAVVLKLECSTILAGPHTRGSDLVSLHVPNDADEAGPWTTLPEQLKKKEEKNRKGLIIQNNIVNK